MRPAPYTMEVALKRSAALAARPNALRPCAAAATALAPSRRQYWTPSRPPPNYPGHIPLNTFEKVALAIGSGLISLANPRRAGASPLPHPHLPKRLTPPPSDLIAAFAEATATPYFIYRLRDAMLASPTGRRILRDRPRITSTSLNLPHLRALPAGTVGRTYVAWLDREGVSPDTRSAVRYIDDPECAYVMQRYRECHDFYHALTGLPVVREGEVALKAFEFANTLLPMTGLSVFAAATLKAGERRRFGETYLPWALRNGLRAGEVINVYWEEELERDVGDLRRELGVQPPPDMRAERRAEREARRRAREGV